MNRFAKLFDLPIESDGHRRLSTTAWMGGDFVTVPYYLGRILRRNLFRESLDDVKGVLADYLIAINCAKGAERFSDFSSWGPISVFLVDRMESETGQTRSQKQRLIAAIYAVLSDPDRTVPEIATLANTTEKQVARMSEVSVLMKNWQQSQNESS